MSDNGIIWFDVTLFAKMVVLPFAFEAALDDLVDSYAERLENYARDNAPWEDRTGDARAGLTGASEKDGDNRMLVLYHTVDYGIWLEVRWSGDYAIILPTIETVGPELMQEFDGFLGKVRG